MREFLGTVDLAPFQRFAGAPSFDPADPNLRYIDLDGDGLADVLVGAPTVFGRAGRYSGSAYLVYGAAGAPT